MAGIQHVEWRMHILRNYLVFISLLERMLIYLYIACCFGIPSLHNPNRETLLEELIIIILNIAQCAAGGT